MYTLEPVFVCVLHTWPISATRKFINQITGLACRNLLRPCGHATANWLFTHRIAWIFSSVDLAGWLVQWFKEDQAFSPLIGFAHKVHSMIYRGPGFLAVVSFWSQSTYIFRVPHVCQKVFSLSQSSCVAPVNLADGWGGGDRVGEEPNYTTVRKPSPS